MRGLVIIVENIAKEIALSLYDTGAIRTWLNDKPEGWKLHSGIWSPFYIQLRTISSQPNSKEVLHKIGKAMGKMIQSKIPDATRLVGVSMAGIPISIAITMCTGIPSCYTRSIIGLRKLEDFELKIENVKKTYGEPRLVEGEFANGDNVVIIDDLVTDFESKLIAKRFVDYEVLKRGLDLTCENVAVLFDREQGADSNAQKAGMTLYSLIPFRSKGIEWLKDRMSPKEYEVIVDYLDNPGKYQHVEVQKSLKHIAKKSKKD